MTIRLIVALAGIALLAGCATMNEDQCRTADWYDLGVRDGLGGEPASRLREHYKACAEFGIRPKEQRYMDGRAEGLREYCRIDNAFLTGLKGQQYRGVCPAAMDRAFRYYNEAAYEVYRLRSEVDSMRNTLDDKERRLREKKLTEEQRADLRQDIRAMDRKLDNLRDELRRQERELDRLADDARDRKNWR